MIVMLYEMENKMGPVLTRKEFAKKIGLQMKPKKENKDAKDKPDNTIQIGQIALSSNKLSLDDLIGRVIALLQDKTIREYLQQFKVIEGLGGSSTYTG